MESSAPWQPWNGIGDGAGPAERHERSVQMTALQPSRLLRGSMLMDAVISGATGLLLVAGAGLLTSLLGVPEALMRYAGLILLPFAAIVLYLARAPQPSRTSVQAVIVLNVAWAAGSMLLLVSGWIEPTWLGMAFVTFQAVVVAGFAELQYAGLRRA